MDVVLHLIQRERDELRVRDEAPGFELRLVHIERLRTGVARDRVASDNHRNRWYKRPWFRWTMQDLRRLEPRGVPLEYALTARCWTVDEAIVLFAAPPEVEITLSDPRSRTRLQEVHVSSRNA